MSGSRGLAILLTAILAGPVLGQGIPFSDEFENGMGNWHRWPEATETLQWDQSVSRIPTHFTPAPHCPTSPPLPRVIVKPSRTVVASAPLSAVTTWYALSVTIGSLLPKSPLRIVALLAGSR